MEPFDHLLEESPTSFVFSVRFTGVTLKFIIFNRERRKPGIGRMHPRPDDLVGRLDDLTLLKSLEHGDGRQKVHVRGLLCVVSRAYYASPRF